MLYHVSLLLLAAPQAPQPVDLAPAAPLDARPLAAAPLQEHAGPQEGVETSTAQVRARRRLVVLKSGGVLRGLTRPTEAGDWQVKGKKGWTDVPAVAVSTVTLEHDVLEEFDEMCEAEDVAPADLLEWTFDAGLLKEGFQLGDRLLADHPRDTDLRAVCTGAGRYVAGLPLRGDDDELMRLRDLGSLGSPVVREVVVERLVMAAPRDAVLVALQEDLKSRQAARRTFAMFALGRLFPAEDPKALLLHAMYDPSEPARAEAARAVAEIGAREIGGPLVRALDSKNAQTRVRAAEALGNTQDEAFVAPLVDRLYTLAAIPQSASGGGRVPHAYIFVGTQSAYVQDFDVEVAQFSSVADPVINTLLEGAVLDVGVIGVDRITVRTEQRSIRRALQKITKFDPGSNSKAWTKWWESDESLPYRPSERKAPQRIRAKPGDGR